MPREYPPNKRIKQLNRPKPSRTISMVQRGSIPVAGYEHLLHITEHGIVQQGGGFVYIGGDTRTNEIRLVGNGFFNSLGATQRANNLSCTRVSTGIYNLTFTTPRPDALYSIVAQVIESDTTRDDTKIHVKDTSQTTTGFTLQVYEGDNGGSPDTRRDRSFYVMVSDTIEIVNSQPMTQLLMSDNSGKLHPVVTTLEQQPISYNSGNSTQGYGSNPDGSYGGE